MTDMDNTKSQQKDGSIRKHSPYLHTVDVVCVRYNRTDERLDVLLSTRSKEPFKGKVALPGLVVNGDQEDQTLADAVKRLMETKVKQPYLYLEQVGTDGNATRDPRCWSTSTFYLAILDEKTEYQPGQIFCPLEDLLGRVQLPFDHNEICAKVAERLYSKSLYSSLPLLLLGQTLTVKEAITVTEVVLNRSVLKSSMVKRLNKMVELGFLEPTEELRRGISKPHKIFKNLKPGEIYFFDRSFEGRG